jgi:hypothetical protein
LSFPLLPGAAEAEADAGAGAEAERAAAGVRQADSGSSEDGAAAAGRRRGVSGSTGEEKAVQADSSSGCGWRGGGCGGPNGTTSGAKVDEDDGHEGMKGEKPLLTGQ